MHSFLASNMFTFRSPFAVSLTSCHSRVRGDISFLNSKDIYTLAELFIVVNTIHHVFLQNSLETDIRYWFNKNWVILPDFLSHYKRPVLLAHFLAGLVSLFGMRYQTSGSHQSDPKTHKRVGYIVLMGQLFVHSPTILIMSTFVTEYASSRKIFYAIAFVATIKTGMLTTKHAVERNWPEHRRTAVTLFHYISTFTKGRIYMYAVLPLVPLEWKAFHVFVSDVVSIAAAEKYSWKKMARLFVTIFGFGMTIEFSPPELWTVWMGLGVAFTIAYA